MRSGGYFGFEQNALYPCPTSQSKGLPAVPAGKVSFFHRQAASLYAISGQPLTVTLGSMTSNNPSDISKQPFAIPQKWLSRWADSSLRIGHLNTLLERAIQEGSLERACALSGRAQSAAFSMFNELVAAGAESAACEPEYPYIYWHRGLACEALGQIEEARKQFDLFGQGLITSKKIPASHLIALVREKFHLYNLDKIYIF